MLLLETLLRDLCEYLNADNSIVFDQETHDLIRYFSIRKLLEVLILWQIESEVLLRLTVGEVKTFNAEKTVNGMSIFIITDVADETIATAMDEKLNSSTTVPNKGIYKNNPSAHVIDESSLTGSSVLL